MSNYKQGLYLQHFGVPGMRWGVRRGSNRVKSYVGGKISEHKAKTAERKAVKTMSDKELQARINRLNMEKQYAQLNQSTIDKGKAAVKGIIEKSAKSTASMYVTKGMVFAAPLIGKMIMDKVKK